MYWSGDRDTMIERLRRAETAGAKGIILTLDWTFSNGRDWGSPWIPEKIDLKAVVKLAPEVLARPQWLWSFAKTGHLPTLTTPNMAPIGTKPPTFFGAYYEWMQSTLPSWDDVAWLRAQWPGPFMVKGVSRVDDARRVVDLGASALSVSNHGGNNLDGTPAPVRSLPAIVDAVGDQIEVLLDGGVRRGSDVVKALALGARAVMIGRACLWGLAANGQAGVENVLDVLRGGIESTMLGLGRANIDELSRADVIAPPDFYRSMGS
jgi:L-lactate dehydrogenase (cytochrome)/glycolate oxidase